MSAFDPQNFYYATTPPPPPHAPLRGETRADVCIVGGGISGLSAALHLAERGFTVALLEAKHLGFGGSGRSGGQTIFGYASGQEKLEKLVGAADARLMWDIALEGMKLQRELIAKHSIACDYVAGHMHVGVKSRHDAELRAEVESLHENYDYHSVRLVGPRRAAHASSPASATPAASTIRTAATCIPTSTRWASAPPPRAPA